MSKPSKDAMSERGMAQVIPNRDGVESAPSGDRPRVLILNRSYWPDGEATGQLLTELTEDLAGRFEVTVIVGHPNTNPSGETYRSIGTQMRHDVRILRVPHTRLPKHSLICRAINFITFLFLAVVRGLFMRRQHVIVLESDPFLLALFGGLLRWRHRAKLVIYLQDIHPDLGVAIGRLKVNLLVKGLRRALRRAYRAADCLIVPSDDMRRTLIAGGAPESVCQTIPNWIDTRRIRPADEPNGFRVREGIAPSQFVVMYSGNFGATQQIEYLLNAAERLREKTDLLFALVGGGSAERGLRKLASDRQLKNVRFFPYQPKERLGESLSAADVHLISVHPRALDYLMPSKLYGIMAVGRPILAVIRPESELAEFIVNENIGTVIPPNDAEALALAIEQARKSPGRLAEQGLRARHLAEREYDRRIVTGRFADMVNELINNAASRPASVAVSMNHE